MTLVAVIGANALYLLYSWLAAAIIASWLSDKKGYGEKVGLASGLLLSLVAVPIWLFIPSKPESDWGRRKAARNGGGDGGKGGNGKGGNGKGGNGGSDGSGGD